MPAERVAFRLAHGLCVQCGEKARPNRRFCQRCADAHLQRSRRWRQKQRAIGYGEIAGYEPAEIGGLKGYVQGGKLVHVEKVVL
jgi:predicted amidophosphoribosyltransferase